MPIEKMTTSQVSLQQCYRIKVGYGDKSKNRQADGDKFEITELIEDYYIGTIVPNREVGQTAIFGRVKDKRRETMFIRLMNGQYLEVYDTSLVINPERLVDAKLIDLYDPDFYIGLHN